MIRTTFWWTAAVPFALAQAADAQSLRLEPRAALIDTTVRLGAVGLESGQAATIRARRRDAAGHIWESAVQALADARGTIDLTRQAPISGSYSGIAPMGLLTSMDVTGEGKGKLRYPFAWSDTVRTEFALEVGGRLAATDTLVQTFVGPGVSRRSVSDSGLVASFFTPPGLRRSPGVMVLGGSEGGLTSEDVASLLASRGYAALAVAYFGVEPLPPTLDEIPLEYFDRALRLLMRDGAVASGGVAIVGTSKGAEAALLIAARHPEVRGVVAYAPSHVVWSCICGGGASHSSWSISGSSVPSVPPGTDPDYRPEPGSPIRPTVNYEYRLRDSASAALAEIPVEHVAGPLLLIAGEADGLWPSGRMARAILARRRRLGGSPADTVLEYSGAGHLIGKAYLPAGSTVIGGGRIETGGSPAANAMAQADAWPRVLRFLGQVMGRPH